jgi:general secretion pathway protein A
MTEVHDLPVRDRWARLRFAIVGPLLAAPPEPGQVRELITALAARRWRHPVTGEDIQFGRSTTRLTDKLRRDELLPLGSRIRSRLATEKASADDLLACLDHLLASAGAPQLMTPPLRHTLCEHALGNYRVLTTLANELLTTAAQRELPELDEKLYFEVFAPSTQSSRRSPARQSNGAR